MKIKLFLVALGFGLFVNAQAQNEKQWFEPAPNTVKVAFNGDFASSDQTTTDGNRMVVTYEKGSKYNFSLTAVHPLKGETMNVDTEKRFLKLIAYQADFYQKENGNALPPVKQNFSSFGNGSFSSSFEIYDYTYEYRIVVLNNVYYLLSASYPTVQKGEKAIAEFFGSFAKAEAPKPINDEE